MWMMLRQEKPDDFVIGSGETHSVREFCEIAFECAAWMIEIMLLKTHNSTVPRGGFVNLEPYESAQDIRLETISELSGISKNDGASRYPAIKSSEQ